MRYQFNIKLIYESVMRSTGANFFEYNRLNGAKALTPGNYGFRAENYTPYVTKSIAVIKPPPRGNSSNSIVFKCRPLSLVGFVVNSSGVE